MEFYPGDLFIHTNITGRGTVVHRRERSEVWKSINGSMVTLEDDDVNLIITRNRISFIVVRDGKVVVV